MEPVCLSASAHSLIDSLFALLTGGKQEDEEKQESNFFFFSVLTRVPPQLLASRNEKMWDS